MTEEAPRRLRRAEAVLRQRCGRFLLVLERCTDIFNHAAVLRTAEAFGLVHVWLVDHDPETAEQFHKSVTKGADGWLKVRSFPDSETCRDTLLAEGWTIYATDLGGDAIPATREELHNLPERLAVVIGRESDGVSKIMLEASEKRIFLPMFGFTESFNLSVATGLILQRLFDVCPEAHGSLSEQDRHELRKDWYQRLGGGKDPDRFLHWIENPPEPWETLRPDPHARRPRMPKKLAKRLGIDLNAPKE
ncbi:MAG: RNA methyltransferase [Planctomycetota bacterium]|nr:RNA methyltransferase [Planctomycetota bacterium]MDA1113634.1 RNA methyltransferase [Planctomycetota bacterium]